MTRAQEELQEANEKLKEAMRKFGICVEQVEKALTDFGALLSSYNSKEEVEEEEPPVLFGGRGRVKKDKTIIQKAMDMENKK